MIVDLTKDSQEGNQNVAENMDESSKEITVDNSPDDDVVIVDTSKEMTAEVAEAVAVQQALLISSIEKKSQKNTGKRAAAGDDKTKGTAGRSRKGEKTMMEKLQEGMSGTTANIKTEKKSQSSSSSMDNFADKLQEGMNIKTEKRSRHSTSPMDTFAALVPPQIHLKTEQKSPTPPIKTDKKTAGLPQAMIGGVTIGGVPAPVPILSEEVVVPETPIKLSESQFKVLEAILQRKSVFFTGAAGTGKSYIIRVLQDIMAHLKRSDKIAFTAPTGVAACNVGGLTIHSWSGIGLGTDSLDKLLSKVMGREEVRKRWLRTEILVIDEISMVSSETFEKLSFLGSRVRNDTRPFGGMQLILCGDFFQVCMCTTG